MISKQTISTGESNCSSIRILKVSTIVRKNSKGSESIGNQNSLECVVLQENSQALKEAVKGTNLRFSQWYNHQMVELDPM